MKILKRLVIIIFVFCSNSGFTQIWEKLEKKIDTYIASKEYSKAFEVSNKMEKYAKVHPDDTSAYLAKVYFYKLILSIYKNESDTSFTYYSFKLTGEIFKFAFSDNYNCIKSDLINFLTLLRTAKIEKTWMYPMFCNNINSLAKIFKTEGDDEGAGRLYKEILDVYSLNNNRNEEYGKALINYSLIQYKQNKYDEVSNNLKEIFFIYDSTELISDNFYFALELYNTLSIETGKYDQAIKINKKYLHTFESYVEVGLNHFFKYYLDLAYLNELAGDFITAEYCYNKLNEIKSKNDRDYLNLLIQHANFLKNIDKYNESETFLKEALQIQKNLYGINNDDYASTLNSLGNLYSKIGNYEKAEQLIIEALKIRKLRLGENNPTYASSLISLGNVYLALGLNSKAEKNILQSLDIRIKSLGINSTYLAENYNSLGCIYIDQKKYELAELYLNKAINVYENNRNNKSPLYLKYLNNLGVLYSCRKEYQKALETHLKILEIRKLNLGENNIEYALCCSNLGFDYLELGDFFNAEKMYLLSSEICFSKLGSNHEYYLHNLNMLAYTNFVQGDFKSAYNLKDKIINHKRKVLNRDFRWLSQKERENYWEKESDFYYYINTYVSKSYKDIPGYSELSYNAILISKSLLLNASIEKYFLNEKSDKINEGIYRNLKNNRILSSKLISDGNKNNEFINKLENQADSLDQLLSRRLGAYKDNKENLILNFKDIQGTLGKDEVSIEFVDYVDDLDNTVRYMALIASKGNKYPELIKLTTENELKQYSTETELKEIYNLIWKPLLPYLTNVKTIYYSPSGLLNNIPFQALFKEENGKREYVMDKFTLHQLTSTRYLALGLKQKEQEPFESSIALFGGINYNDYPNAITNRTNYNESAEAAFLYKNAIVLNRELDSTRTGASYLPGTKKEVEIIAGVLNSKKWQVDVSEGKNATENKIKSFSGNNSKAILHIATHGFAFPDKEEKRKDIELKMMNGNDKYKASDNPMIRCGLLFGGANMTWQGKGDSLLNTTNEDGVLTAYELSQLDLSNTKLAVLSACETGKGEIQGSEGTFGLKRALKLAGVDNMIVSLWKVPDDATMEMMTLFYTELSNTKKPVSSFETAQKAMRLRYPNEPKKWAGFVFVR